MRKPKKLSSHWRAALALFCVVAAGIVAAALYWDVGLPCSVSRQPLLFVRSSTQVDVTWSVRSSPFSVPQAEIHVLNVKKRAVSFETPVRRHAVAGGWLMRWLNFTVEYRFRATLRMLQPGSTYQFDILEGFSDGGKKMVYSSEFYWMADEASSSSRSGSSWDEAVQVGVVSDNQLGAAAFASILSALKTFKKVHYVVHAGDAVQDYTSSSQWEGLFAGVWADAYKGERGGREEAEEMAKDRCYLFSTPPALIYAHGNHDEDATGGYWHTTGPREGANHFAVTLGPARFVALDSWPPDMSGAAQLRWLRDEAAGRPWQQASFRIAVFHQPPFIEHWDPRTWETNGEKYWNKHVRTVLLPELLRHGVDLVISGHQHCYSRGWLAPAVAQALTSPDPELFHNASSGRARARATARAHRWAMRNQSAADGTADGPNGPSYVTAQGHAMLTVVGGAGGALDLLPVEDWGHVEVTVPRTHHFAVLNVRNDRLLWRAYTKDLEVIDAFQLLRGKQ